MIVIDDKTVALLNWCYLKTIFHMTFDGMAVIVKHNFYMACSCADWLIAVF